MLKNLRLQIYNFLKLILTKYLSFKKNNPATHHHTNSTYYLPLSLIKITETLIEIGKYNELSIMRETSVGIYLSDDEGEDVLLPHKYCPKEFKIWDKLKVFVYRDHEDRKVATNIIPKILLHDFAFLKVIDMSAAGAFLDWGMEKDLIVPYSEQRQRMEVGRWYVVYLEIEKENDRLFASNKTDKFLQNDELSVKEGDEVDLMLTSHTDLGYTAIINKKHKGLIFEDEVFQKLDIGDKLKGFVKKIRTDNKIDISLQAIGYDQYNDANTEKILKALADNDGTLDLSDKSSPDDIYRRLGMSKKAFKKSLGALYQQRKISMDKQGIKLV